MNKNIFIIGSDKFNMDILKGLPKASDYNFHPLLHFHEIRGADVLDIDDLLNKCRERLDRFQGSIDAIIGFFDFPVTIMQPILAKEYNVAAPSLESIFKSEHKYWSRLEQQKAIPDYMPLFEAFDPFDEAVTKKISLLYPFWIKPMKSFRSYLAYRINDELTFWDSLEEVRLYISKINQPFQQLLKFIDLPPEIQELGPKTCIAESLLSGSMCTVEGYVYQGDIHIYGIVDSIREADRSSFSRYEYPSNLPARVTERMVEVSHKIIEQIGYDNGTFNIEFFYNQTEDSLSLLEINPRLSQSHAYLFQHVHGISHHQIMIDLALGNRPDYPFEPQKNRVAAKFMLRTFNDAFVTRIPSQREIRHLLKIIPEAIFEMQIQEGVRLSRLQNQDSYSFEIGDLYLVGKDRLDLLEKYNTAINALPFRIAQEMSMSLI